MISQRATEIFLEARTLDLETRAEFLSTACAGSDELRAEVDSLLAASSQAEAYFDDLAGKVSLSALANDDDESMAIDKVVGSWRILKRIGRGGMGAVYLAERADEQFEHQAALKILPMGLDTGQGRARFLIERQILARLVHDNIARLLDGGVTDEGLPYFVMDYVDGKPIDDYCEQNNLDIKERLALILDVARAVQYAHGNLIIHRDIKPSNVFVDDGGRVRLLDFGIAKMLQPDADSARLTQESRRPTTPAFASPEMLRGEPVDVTTDVYSIGALMYVLLTARLPLEYDGLSLSEIYDRAANTIPDPISRFDPRLAGDLEVIVAKSLAKLPEERYESIQSLADDIRNYLDGLPVTAKTPSAAYKARKFIGRHRIGVAFSVFAIIALATITGIAVRSAIISERQSEQIALERDRAEQTKDFLISIFDSADPNMVPGEQTAREILEAGRARIEEELAGQPEVQADLLRAMSNVYQNWRLTTEGRSVLERELELRKTVNGSNSQEYADALVALAYITEIGGDYDSSLDYARQALAVFEDIDQPIGQSQALERIGRVLHLQGDLDAALVQFDRAMNLIIKQLGADAFEVTFISEHLANLYNHQQQYEKALAEFERTLAIRRKHVDGDSSIISPIYLGMGSVLTALDRFDEASDAYETGIAMNERLFGEDNSYALYFVNGLGKVAEGRGDLVAAVSHYKESRRLILRDMPESPNLAFATANIGRAYLLQGEYESALPFYQSALEIFEEKLPQHWARGGVSWRLGLCLVETGNFAEAEPLILSGIDIVEKHWGPDHESTRGAREAAARLYEATDRLALAEDFR